MKKLFILLLLFISLKTLGQTFPQIVNVGTTPNDHTGDPLRNAFIKQNANWLSVLDSLLNKYTIEQINTFLNDTITLIDVGFIKSDTILTLFTQHDASLLTVNAETGKLQFRVDTTLGAPLHGDSILLFNDLIDKHIEVVRNGEIQFHNTTGVPNITDGYRFNSTTGQIIFRPVFLTNTKVIIYITIDAGWTDLTLAELGPEKVTNGVFDSDTYWDKYVGTIITGGKAVVNTAYEYVTVIKQDIAIEVAKEYRLEYDIIYTSGEWKAGFGTGVDGVFGPELSITGHYIHDLTIPGGCSLQVTFLSFDLGANLTIDNVSVREIL